MNIFYEGKDNNKNKPNEQFFALDRVSIAYNVRLEFRFTDQSIIYLSKTTHVYYTTWRKHYSLAYIFLIFPYIKWKIILSIQCAVNNIFPKYYVYIPNLEFLFDTRIAFYNYAD